MDPWYRRLPPNIFSIAFGLSGLAAMWRAMDATVPGVRPVVLALTIVATGVWVVCLGGYIVKCSRPGALKADVDHPVQGPFISVIFIAAMMLAMLWFWLGVHSARYLALAAAICALVFGGWITGHWIAGQFDVDLMNPGYFLPTVAGGLVAATALQVVGYRDLALMAFGIGVVTWVVLGSVLLQRLFVGPALPTSLVPLLAIELAPPAVAGNAWVALNPVPDPVQWGLLAYTLLMVIVQVRLIPEYRKVPFGPAFWSFAFSYAAAATYAMHWLRIDPIPGGRACAWVLALTLSGFVGWIAARTVAMMRQGRYLPREVAQSVSGGGGSR
ncbi:MAG: hypothetical protein MUF33_05980 [Candidatus Nanopelagicales bacterium]|nr:hypothetical protein [Candidatus Nanopelagicales bacterium]